MKRITPGEFATKYFGDLSSLEQVTDSAAFFIFSGTHALAINLVTDFGGIINNANDANPAGRLVSAWSQALDVFLEGDTLNARGFVAVTRYGNQIMIDTVFAAAIDLGTVLSNGATSSGEQFVVFLPSIPHIKELNQQLTFALWMQVVLDSLARSGNETVTFIVETQMADTLLLALDRKAEASQLLENVAGSWWTALTVQAATTVAAT